MKSRLWKYMKSFFIKWWYSRINLYKNLINKSNSIHRLVAQHFIPNPNNLPCVLHRKEDLDENWRLYNWEDNLFWWTHTDNMRDKHNKWRANNHLQKNNFMKWKFWKDHHSSKKVNQYSLEWEFIKTWDSLMDIERELWIKNVCISYCCRWKYKKSWWFKWEYK